MLNSWEFKIWKIWNYLRQFRRLKTIFHSWSSPVFYLHASLHLWSVGMCSGFFIQPWQWVLYNTCLSRSFGLAVNEGSGKHSRLMICSSPLAPHQLSTSVLTVSSTDHPKYPPTFCIWTSCAYCQPGPK